MIRKVTDKRNSAIEVAAERGDVAEVERLMQDPCVDPSANGNAALLWAARRSHLAVVERLMQDPRVDPSVNNNSALQFAAWHGDLAIIDRLMQDVRVDPSDRDNYFIELAAMHGRFAVIDRLLEDSRVDVAGAIRYSHPEDRRRFECRERLTEICIALQDLSLPAWVTIKILYAARPWSTLQLHSKWALVCTVKHFHDKHPRAD